MRQYHLLDIRQRDVSRGLRIVQTTIGVFFNNVLFIASAHGKLLCGVIRFLIVLFIDAN